MSTHFYALSAVNGKRCKNLFDDVKATPENYHWVGSLVMAEVAGYFSAYRPQAASCLVQFSTPSGKLIRGSLENSLPIKYWMERDGYGLIAEDAVKMGTWIQREADLSPKNRRVFRNKAVYSCMQGYTKDTLSHAIQYDWSIFQDLKDHTLNQEKFYNLGAWMIQSDGFMMV